MASKFFKAAFQFGKTVTKKLKGNKAKNPQAIKSVPVGKNLKTKRFQQDDIIKTREKVMTEYGIKDPKSRVALRTKANQPKINKKIADIADRQDKARVKKMGGGMMGRRMGYSQGSNGKIKFDAKKSDLDKSGSLSPYEKRRGMAIAKAMAKRKKKA